MRHIYRFCSSKIISILVRINLSLLTFASPALDAKIECLPSEIGHHILSLVDLKDYETVRGVNRIFQNWADDRNGPFKDILAFKEVFAGQNQLLSSQNLMKLEAYSKALKELRDALGRSLSARPLPQQQDFARQIFKRISMHPRLMSIITNPDLKEIQNFNTLWLSLALLRTFDKLKIPEIPNWLENQMLRSLHYEEYTQKAFVLLDTIDVLWDSFSSSYKAPTKQVFLVEEMCAREGKTNFCEDMRFAVFLMGADLQPKIMDAGPYPNEQDKWQLSSQYLSAAADAYLLLADSSKTEDDETFGPLYEAAAFGYYITGDFERATRYYAHAFKQGFTFTKYVDIYVGRAYFNLQNYEKSAEYFARGLKKKIIDGTPDEKESVWIYQHVVQAYKEKWLTLKSVEIEGVSVSNLNFNHCPEDYLNAGYAFAKLRQFDKAGDFFKKYIDGAPDLMPNFHPDALTLMEEALHALRADEPYFNWIVKNKEIKNEKKST